MGNSIEDRAIIVTGAGRGIGRAIALGLASAGARVAIADIDPATTSATAAEIRDLGGTAIGIATDVTSRASIRAAIAGTVAEFGRLDAMFNNAGIAQVKPFNDITEDDWHRVMDVNAMSVLIGIQEVSKQFIAQGGGGKIINTASIAGRQGYAEFAPYCASKAAVISLTQAGAREFAKNKITVNAFAPGVVVTPLWDGLEQDMIDKGVIKKKGEFIESFSSSILLGFPSKPEDLAGIAAFLASPDSDYITGQVIMSDGGMVLV